MEARPCPLYAGRKSMTVGGDACLRLRPGTSAHYQIFGRSSKRVSDRVRYARSQARARSFRRDFALILGARMVVPKMSGRQEPATQRPLTRMLQEGF